MIKAVVFDLDGTLLNTITDISNSVNAVLKSMGYYQFSEDDYKYFVGRGVDELITKVIEVGELNPEEFYEIKTGYLEEYAKRKTENTKPYEGIIELLKALNNLQIKVCILSNKPHFQTIDVVEQYFSEIHMTEVYGKKKEFPIKPDPTSLFDMINQLGMERSEILYVGDTNTDMETAVNAGLKKVGVLWGFRTKQELLAAGADYIVEQPSDILRLVKR